MTAENNGAMGSALGNLDSAGHRAQVGVECPVCRWRHFLEVNFDLATLDARSSQEVARQLQEWLRSRCPDHLGPFLKASKS